MSNIIENKYKLVPKQDDDNYELTRGDYPKFSYSIRFDDGDAMESSSTFDCIEVRDKYTVTVYERISYFELLVKDENGNNVWVDGRYIPSLKSIKERYLNDIRRAASFEIIVYDIRKKEKTIYSGPSVKKEEMSDYERIKYRILLDEEKERWFELINDNPENYNKLPLNLKFNIVFNNYLLEAVYNCEFMKYVVDPISTYDPFILKALKKDGNALQYLNDVYRSNRFFVNIAISNNGCALEFADNSLKSDRGIVLAAVSNRGCALEFADNSLKSDRDIVLAAVTNDGYALEYADDSLKKDKDILALQFADESFNKYKDIL